jgi:hypothetical protein
MASEKGRVIQFPSRLQTRSCFDCEWFSTLSDRVGISSFCGLFDEPILDETQAKDCEAWTP